MLKFQKIYVSHQCNPCSLLKQKNGKQTTPAVNSKTWILFTA